VGDRRLPTFIVWAAVVHVCVAQEISNAHWGRGPSSWQAIALIQSATWSAWAVLMLLVVRAFCRRLPLKGPRVSIHALAHLGAAAALGTVACWIGAVVAGLHYYGLSTAAVWDMFRDRLHTALGGTVLVYGAVVVGMSREWDQPTIRPALTFLQRLIAKDDGCLLVVPTTEVDWLEADDDTVRIHAGKRVHTMRDTLTSLNERLNPRRFARIHRSTIVNLDRVREVQLWFKGEHVLLLTDGTRLTIGPTYRDQLLERLKGDRDR